MRSPREALILEKLWDIMTGAGMLLGASIAITLAIVIPFIIFGGLFVRFCK